MGKAIINYDELLEKIPYKYAIPIVVAKRAEALNDMAKPFVSSPDEYPVSIAFKELQEGYIRIKNEDILKILIPEVK
ncbi:MAG TPA: DNA-directed RNA polymerase subunit omega [Fervidobacterium sp.]|nr:DNA-directed RNA polymerase subunit omega [Fervidobacterium sp.]HOK87847.1 DNA-directed RNA polymerase subunit omega [Fervidobacterium sp.]HOQ39654.1 DNA-directed RNA polymerase subunit omega [Fervidobacterium sp.]HPP17834.1 DNA-directed RNA polymerase subunit omega [Fervidobacterium sp.]HPT54627.1 DNA-directed RNA polymerase subunit omega [Fervidobacterium sp.]